MLRIKATSNTLPALVSWPKLQDGPSLSPDSPRLRRAPPETPKRAGSISERARKPTISGRLQGVGGPTGEIIRVVSDILDIFKRQGALLEGHFLLSSGLHSAQYLQCARVLMDTGIASELGGQLAARFRAGGVTPDVVVGPAMGGIVIGHEVARGFGCRSIFTERDGGSMTLRRGFALASGETVVIVEDVVTTGKSTGEVMRVVEAAGGRVIGVAALVDRTWGGAGFEVPFEALLKISVDTWSPTACPLCASGSKAVKPGSRPA